jgi:phenylalanyl-tRNA synthetase beta chain
VQRHLGETADGLGICAEVVERYLTALGCVLAAGEEQGEYSVRLPSWRLDLAREIDLIEEVARVHGYNKFANTLPSAAGAVIEQPHAAQERVIRETLRGLGYSEAVSSTFVSEGEAEVFGAAGEGAVAMGNPLSAEAGMLRPSLVPGMATMLGVNLHRDVSAVRLFEMGTVFTGSTEAVRERAGLVLGATGDAQATALYGAADALFYAVKGVLERLLAKFVGAVTFEAAGLPAWMAAGRGARVLLDGKVVGMFGELSAAEAERRKLRQTCVVASVDAQMLWETALRSPMARELSRYPAVERDFSFVFVDAVRWTSLEEAVRGLGIAELRSVRPVEVFRDAKGKAVAAGSYSMLVRVVFQSGERTLTEEELTGWSARVVATLVGLGGVQRV